MLYMIAAGVTILSLGWVLFCALAIWFGSGWFRFVRYHRHKELPLPDGPRWSDRIGHWLGETWALVLIHVWRLERGPTQLSPAASGRPVVCIHGFTQDRTNFSALRRRLWTAGRPSISLDLGLPGKHPRQLAPRVLAGLNQALTDYPGERLDIVCHSMGGLVLREALAKQPELAAHIHTIVTLGSPHQGTAGARWPVRIWPEAGGLARGSRWLKSLPTLAELAPDSRTVTIGGSADYVVYPLSTNHLPGSEAVDMHGLGHCGLLCNEQVMEVIEAAFEGRPLPLSPGASRTHPA